MQMQRFITTIKNVTEEKKFKSLIGLIVPLKSTTTTEEGKREKIERKKYPKESKEQVKTQE